jgi:RecB family exonuclease
LRVDRIDQDREGKLVIIDYKSGAPKRLLGADGQPKDMQLVVYAYVAARPVAAIALLNIDTRSVALDGVGEMFPPKTDWSEALSAWFAKVEIAASEIVGGDVRINALQTVAQARPLSLLSRFRELQLEH